MVKKRDYVLSVHPPKPENFGLSALKYALNPVGKKEGFDYINAVNAVTNGIQPI